MVKILKYRKTNISIEYWAKDTVGSLHAYEKLVSLLSEKKCD